MKETDQNFTIVYHHKTDSYAIDFEVYEIIAHSKADNGEFTVPHYEGKGGCGMDDKETTDIEKAQSFIRGSVKWDGCSHFYFGDEEGYIHLCGKREIEKLQNVIKQVYKKCGELLGEKALKEKFK